MPLIISSDVVGEFACPYCKCRHTISSWDTDCETPLAGRHTIKCINCDREFYLHVTVIVDYEAKAINAE